MWSRLLRWTVCLVAAAALWLPLVRYAFRPPVDAVRSPPTRVPPLARALAEAQLARWEHPPPVDPEADRLRRTNPEWDFMQRTYLVLALANLALRDPPQRARYVRAMDAILDDTLAAEEAHGMHWFLLPYSRAGAWRDPAERSVFVDGELALMLGARRLLGDVPRYAAEMRARVGRFDAVMAGAPVLSAESYPHECWTFCNTLALAATRVLDVLDHTDHAALRRGWVETARRRLVEPRTGLLVSSYTPDGAWRDGPEGSSIFMAAQDLRLVDRAFADDQYRRARRSLGRTALGFGYAREWPEEAPARDDVDSGPTVPLLGANAGASGMALLGAGAFGDTEYLRALVASLELAAFPVREAGRLRYAASNGVGDAVLLYALVQGPLWDAVEAR